MAGPITPKDVIKIVDATINFLDINLVEENLSPSSEMERQETVDRLNKLKLELHAITSFISSSHKPTGSDHAQTTLSNKLSRTDTPESPIIDKYVSKLKVLGKMSFAEVKERAVYHGALRKHKKQLISKWNRRLCFLCDGILLYFQSETDTKAKGYIVVGGYKLIIPPNSNGYTFNLESYDSSTVYSFQADQKKELLNWKEHLMRVVDMGYSEHDLQTINLLMKDSAESIEGHVPGDEDEDLAQPSTHKEIAGVSEQNGLSMFESAPVVDTSAYTEQEEYEDVASNQMSDQQSNVAEEFSRENIYIGAYQCHSDGPQDLSFHHGDVMYILEKIDMNWWLAFLNGKVGLVPRNFLTPAFISGS